jgi:hypothetical protein
MGRFDPDGCATASTASREDDTANPAANSRREMGKAGIVGKPPGCNLCDLESGSVLGSRVIDLDILLLEPTDQTRIEGWQRFGQSIRPIVLEVQTVSTPGRAQPSSRFGWVRGAIGRPGANVSLVLEGPLWGSRGWTLDHINGSHDVDSQ